MSELVLGEVQYKKVATHIKVTTWEAHFKLAEAEKERLPEMLQAVITIAYQPVIGSLIHYRDEIWEVAQVMQFAATYKSRQKRRVPVLILELWSGDRSSLPDGIL
ncbi:MAG: hypothetical protein H7Z11_16985 [Verrucomicrobia bacterium]|nr:hypothetical protein [Leptolyngbya sp. ES-bin-22]